MNCLELIEKTNIKTINQLLFSDYINDYEKKALTKYKKNVCNNEATVYYKFAKGAENGRIFANNSLSLQMFERKIRHTLANDLYTDVDIKNAHPTILSQYCKKNSWVCDNLNNYNNNRENILEEISTHYDINRETAKQKIISIINGGEAVYNSSADTEFIKNFKNEMKAIRSNVWNKEIELRKYVEDKRRRKGNDFNKEGALINTTMTGIENEILMCMKKFFDRKNYIVGVLVFDGLMIEKNDEYKVDNAILDECCDFVKKNMDWDIKLTTKPMDEGFDMSIFDKEDYYSIKKVVEKQYSKLKSCYCFIDLNNGSLVKERDLGFHLKNQGCYLHGEFKPFFKLWCEDRDILTYKDIDFLPYPLKCEEETYNLFDGFEGDVEPTQQTNIDKILDHIMNLSGRDEECFEYFLNWMADIVQDAGHLKGVAIVLKSDQGAGKNIFLDFFGKKVLGTKYYTTTAKAEDLFGRFATGIKNKLLINLDETSGADTFKYSENIKNLLTAENISYEQKGIDTITINNFARWIFSTNNNTPVKIDQTDRRWVVFECNNDICQNSNYFTELATCFNDENSAPAFYKFLKERDLSNFNIRDDRPITDIYKDIRSATIPVEYYLLDYIVSISNGKDVVKYTNKELYKHYCNFCDQNGFNNRINISHLGRKMTALSKKNEGISAYRSSTERGYSFDIKIILDVLKKYF